MDTGETVVFLLLGPYIQDQPPPLTWDWQWINLIRPNFSVYSKIIHTALSVITNPAPVLLWPGLIYDLVASGALYIH
jgi:hypothetical protein